MVDPKIVYCSNNHIYDESIHMECPYCSRIAENQRALTELVYDTQSIKEKMDFEDEHTELIRVSSVNGVEDGDNLDEHTELLFVHEQKKTEAIENTEIIRFDDSDAQCDIDDFQMPYVVGWMVCKDGIQKGRSFEIVEGNNYIYKDKSKIVISPFSNMWEQAIGEIFKDTKTGDFVLKPALGEFCMVNNTTIQESIVLKPYDTVVLAGNSCLLVELISEFIEWGI